MEKKYLTQSFAKENVPPWRCPSCESGRLKLVGEFSVHSDAATQNSSNEEWFEPEYSNYIFTGILCCENCREKVAVSGAGNVEEDYGEDGREYYTLLTPKFFHPPLRIIEPSISKDVPADVIVYLEKAFQIFWCDADSCVNRLRTVVEYLLDGIGIDRNHPKGDRLSLAARINLLVEPQHVEVKDALTSLRYMGNDGSHGSVGIERHELLLAFAVVKYCLEKLFPNVSDESEVLTFVSEVNQRKGFRES